MICIRGNEIALDSMGADGRPAVGAPRVVSLFRVAIQSRSLGALNLLLILQKSLFYIEQLNIIMKKIIIIIKNHDVQHEHQEEMIHSFNHHVHEIICCELARVFAINDDSMTMQNRRLFLNWKGN